MNKLIDRDGIEFPFPVDVPFRMKSGLRKLDQNEYLFQYTNSKQFAAYQREKLAVNRPIALGKRAKEAEDLLFRFWNDSNLWGMLPLGSSAKSFLETVRNSLMEDFVVLLPNESTGELVAEILDVQFPSGWDPMKKVGMAFSALHEPVADAKFLKPGPANSFSRILVTDGPFRRHVWTLATSPSLAAVPNRFPVASMEDIWFRVETQTTIPLPERLGVLFLIHVQTVNLVHDVMKINGKKPLDLLRESLATMSSSVLAYKNLGGFVEFFAANASNSMEFEPEFRLLEAS